VVYVLDPALGRMQDWSNGALVSTWRLTGVFGAANGAGAAGAIGLLFMVLLSGISWRKPRFFLLAAPMAACLLLSDNRMSMIGLGAGLLYVWFARGNLGLKLAGAILLAGVGVLLMTGFGDLILSSLSRSGSIQEIETATGRTQIWAVAFDLWTQQPLFGYGGGSAKFILPVHPLLFKAAAHAHDLYLNVLFEGGAVGLLIFLWGLVSALWRVWSRRVHSLMGVLVFFLLYGITEPMIEGVASFVPLGFYAVLVLSVCPREPRAAAGSELSSGK
jgi:O-antigen ligase